MSSTSILLLSSASLVCFCIFLTVLLVVFKKQVCNKVTLPVLCKKESGGGGSSSPSGGGSGENIPGGGDSSGKPLAADAAKPGGEPGKAGDLFGKMVMTNFTFENNTPCNSMSSNNEKDLIPYVSVSLQFRYLKDKNGGPLKLNDWIFLKFLEGRVMPNKKKHTGWVRIDTYCGDMADDDYCFQDVSGGRYPLVDLYIGSFPKSGQKCDGKGGMIGPGGSGQEMTEVRFGPPPAGKAITSYGGAAKGPGACNDCVSACEIQTGLKGGECLNVPTPGNKDSSNALQNKCWWYWPQNNNEARTWCTPQNAAAGTYGINGKPAGAKAK